jgi:hypothetical protein
MLLRASASTPEAVPEEAPVVAGRFVVAKPREVARLDGAEDGVGGLGRCLDLDPRPPEVGSRWESSVAILESASASTSYSGR